MVSFTRKFLPITRNDSCLPPLPTAVIGPPRMMFPAPPPPPPLARPSVNEPYSPVLVILFGGLAVSFCFICYLICATRYLRRRPNNANTNYETREDFLNEELGPITLHPIWLINTIGLDQSQIESIQLFKYKRDEKLIEDTDCSVCLSEFEDDESLRLLPKCSHAFHVPCIDTWLRSHKNCPLCRAQIFNNTNDQPNMIASGTHEESETITIPVNDAETIDDHDHDHHVIEVDNSGEMVKTSSVVDETSSSSSQGEELVAMRRSVSNGQLVASKKPSSMRKSEHKRKGSSSSIRDLSKVTKTSSFALPLRKASSFTSKSRPLNQSY